jgi:hypothetical protein
MSIYSTRKPAITNNLISKIAKLITARLAKPAKDSVTKAEDGFWAYTEAGGEADTTSFKGIL